MWVVVSIWTPGGTTLGAMFKNEILEQLAAKPDVSFYGAFGSKRRPFLLLLFYGWDVMIKGRVDFFSL